MSRCPPPWFLVGLWCVLAVVAHPLPVAAQPADGAERFDLILFGDALHPDRQTVFLRSNPTAGDAWTPMNRTECVNTDRVLVLPDLAPERYLGQDLRENYLALRITSTSAGGSLRAAYAVPSVHPWTGTTCETVAQLTTQRPMIVRRHSLAVYERPRPAPLRPGTPFIDHVEAPVRHRKPGVVEVEWLEILFGPDG